MFFWTVPVTVYILIYVLYDVWVQNFQVLLAKKTEREFGSPTRSDKRRKDRSGGSTRREFLQSNIYIHGARGIFKLQTLNGEIREYSPNETKANVAEFSFL
jgi:hypothetical protein